LETIRRYSNVDIQLYVTRPVSTEPGFCKAAAETIAIPPAAYIGSAHGGRPTLSVITDLPPRRKDESRPGSADEEKGWAGSSSASPSTPDTPQTRTAVLPAIPPAIGAGRPDVADIIETAVAAVPSGGRILIMGCGPAGMMSAIRRSTLVKTGGGPGVEVHCEEFGW